MKGLALVMFAMSSAAIVTAKAAPLRFNIQLGDTSDSVSEGPGPQGAPLLVNTVRTGHHHHPRFYPAPTQYEKRARSPLDLVGLVGGFIQDLFYGEEEYDAPLTVKFAKTNANSNVWNPTFDDQTHIDVEDEEDVPVIRPSTHSRGRTHAGPTIIRPSLEAERALLESSEIPEDPHKVPVIRPATNIKEEK